VTNAAGTCRTRLTDIPGLIKTAPLWQPAGNKIAFGASNNIYTVSVEGSSEILLDIPFDENAKEPSAWSPDGKTLVFLNEKIDGSILNVIVAGGRASLASKVLHRYTVIPRP
jgi:Tol biopolymer transport system component